MVLLIVMVVVAMLSYAGLSFLTNISVEHKASFFEGQQLQLEQALLSGVEYVKAFCEQSAQERDSAGGFGESSRIFEGVPVCDDPAFLGKYQFTVLVPERRRSIAGPRQFGVQSESAKLSLAAILEWESARSGSAREALLNLPGMTESIADSILDWMDEDDRPRAQGAEADYYAGLGLPYRPRNGVPFALEELLLVRGISRAQLFGESGSRQRDTVPRAATSVTGNNAWSGGELPWANFLTTYSAERNTSYDGRPRIYLNHPDLTQLHEQLREEFGQSVADFVVLLRQFGAESQASVQSPDQSASSRRSRWGRWGSRRRISADQEPTAEAEQTFPMQASDSAGSQVTIDFSQPLRFQLASPLDIVGTRVRVVRPNEENPRFIASPYTLEPSNLANYLPNWLDRTTTFREPVIRGRIDVMLAPAEVLRAIPGFDEAIVQRILSTRASGTEGRSSHRKSLAWLVTEGIVSVGQLRSMERYITARSDVFCAEIVATADQLPGLSLAARVIVDATNIPARQLYWKQWFISGE